MAVSVPALNATSLLQPSRWTKSAFKPACRNQSRLCWGHPVARRGRLEGSILLRTAQESSIETVVADSATEYVEDKDFSITKVSFGSILTPLGVGLLVYGFGAYFTLLPGTDVSSVLLIYGFPLSLLGFALSYAQLKPVPCKTTKKALELRGSQMTDIQKQVREDVTRYRYGDEQHLDEALAKVFMLGRQGGVPRRLCPVLVGIREETVGGMYTLVLEFESKLEFQKWEERQPKFQSFFGPGIIAKMKQTDAGADVYLICDGTGAGRTGKEKKDVLPPLMPGMKPRQQD